MLNWKVAIENALVNGLAASKYEVTWLVSQIYLHLITDLKIGQMFLMNIELYLITFL